MSKKPDESPGDNGVVVYTTVTEFDERVDYLRTAIAEGIRESVETGSTEQRQIWFACMQSLDQLEKAVDELYAIDRQNKQNEDD